MTIAQTPASELLSPREVGTLRLPSAGAEAQSAALGDSTTIDEDTRALLEAMRRIATQEAGAGAASPQTLARLRAQVRAGGLEVDPHRLAAAILRDEGQ